MNDAAVKSILMGLDGVELVLEMEEAFGVIIPDETAEQSLTVGDFHRTLVGLRMAQHHLPHSPELGGDTWERRVTLISEQMSLPRSEIRPDAHWIADIGLG